MESDIIKIDPRRSVQPDCDIYGGGWVNVVCCKGCGIVSQDDYATTPCFKCGSRERKVYVGKYIPPFRKGIWPFRKTVKPGYWEIKL